MNEKEKAKELIEKFLDLVDCGDNRYTNKTQYENAKQCALICVDEKIVFLNELFHPPKGDIEYWQYVKTEIENYEL